MSIITKPSDDLLREKKQLLLDRIYDHHLRKWADSDGNVFFISDGYPGLWLEHTFDSVAWANYMPSDHEVSRNQVKLYIDHQNEKGSLPCAVWSHEICYGWTQECVSFSSLAYEAWQQNRNEPGLLEKFYDGCVKWVNWAYNYRMPHKTGLVEMFCGYDTGHDNSARVRDLKYQGDYNHYDNGDCPTDDPYLPIIAPDLNAVFYGNIMACSKMAAELGLTAEAEEWKKKAEEVKKLMYEICFDEEDCFFYDVDKNGNKRKIKSCAITNILTERALDEGLAQEIIKRHILNPKEFWAPYPICAVAMNDPTWIRNADGNSWGYYTQGLTCLRTLRWMEHYGLSSQLEEIMAKWVNCWTYSTTTQFGQEVDPITGKPSTASDYYSSCMIFYLTSIRRLYGI